MVVGLLNAHLNRPRLNAFGRRHVLQRMAATSDQLLAPKSLQNDLIKLEAIEVVFRTFSTT